MLSLVQAAEMGFLRRVHGVTLRDKVPSCEIRKVLNVCLAASPDKEISATLVWSCVQNVSVKIVEATAAAYTDGRAAQRSSKRSGGGTASQTSLGLVLVWSQQNCLKLLKS